MNQNPFGGQDPFEYLRRQMEEQLRQKQQKTNWTSILLPNAFMELVTLQESAS